MQQCICAIELIGARFLRDRHEVAALRRIRDDLLATTEAGRAWIALFERVQLPLLTTLMADEQLSSQAAELVKRAAELAKSYRTRVRDADVEAAIRFVRTLVEAPEPRRYALTCAQSSAGSKPCAGLTTARVLASLMAEPPHSPHAKGAPQDARIEAGDHRTGP